MSSKILFIGCMFLGLNAFGADAYLAKSSDIFLGSKPVGKVKVLTPVKVLSSDSKRSKIKIDGVVNQNYELVIQKSIPNSEIYAIFDKEDAKNFKKLDELEDDYGELWSRVEGVYEVASADLVNDPSALYKNAKEIYEQTCSACHRLHEPNSFTANQWPANLQGMINANYVVLEDDELELITKYLQQNSKK